MAKFCIHCGRPLEEGEVCNCQSNVNPQDAVQQQNETLQSNNVQNQGTTNGSSTNQNVSSNELGNKIKFVFSKVLNMFKSPSATINEFIEKNDSQYGVIMMAINVIGIFVISLIQFLYLNSKLYNMLPVAQLVIIAVIIAAVSTFGFASLLFVFTNKAFKSDASLAHIFSINGVTSVLSICLQIVVILFTLLSAKFGLILSVISFIYTSVIFITNYNETVKLDTDKKTYALFITYGAIFIIQLIIFSMFVSSAISGTLGSFSSLFGSY